MLNFGNVDPIQGIGGNLFPGISRLSDEIEMKFQRLAPCLRNRAFPGANTAG